MLGFLGGAVSVLGQVGGIAGRAGQAVGKAKGIVNSVKSLFGGGGTTGGPTGRGFGGSLRDFERWLGIRTGRGKKSTLTRPLTAAEQALFQAGGWRKMTPPTGGTAPTMGSGATGQMNALLSSMAPTTGGIRATTPSGPGGVPVGPTIGLGAVGAAGVLTPPVAASTVPAGIATFTQVANRALMVGRGVARILGPRSPGGYGVGVRGDDFIATGGYPLSDTAYEDFREQTYTPDLWARRVTRGVAVLAAPIKRGYSVPLVDWEGDIEGRIRATGGPIKKSAVIVYAGASDPDNQSHLIGHLLRGYRATKFCEVVDEEGGSSGAIVGTVYEPPKRRRGGIHISKRELANAKRTARNLKRLASTHKELKRLLPR